MFALLRCLALLLLFLLPVCAGARVSLIESDIGLPDKQITAISRDNRGLMWIGTRQGLCSFDGYRFMPLSHPGLRAATINRLIYDPQTDILWVYTGTGMYMLHCRELQIRAAGSQRDGAVTAGCLAGAGRIYAAYHSGAIYRIDSQGRSQLLMRLPANGYPGEHASRMDLDGPNTLLIRSESGARYYIADLRRNDIAVLPIAAVGMNPFFIKRSSRWRAYFGESRLYLQDTALRLGASVTGTVPFHMPNIVDVASDGSGDNYALGKPSRLFRLNTETQRPDTIHSELFTGRSFNCFFFDADGIIWIGTNKGLLKITDDQRLFQQLLVRNPQVSVRTLAVDENGTYYAGTYSGLFSSKDDGQHWSNISTQLPNRIINLPGPYLYFAGGDSGLYRIRKSDGAIQTRFWAGAGPAKERVGEAYALFEQRGRIWIGGSHGLLYYDPSEGIFSAWDGNRQLPDDTHINFISGDGAGGLRLCTNYGLYEISNRGNISGHFSTTTKPALGANRLLHASTDTAGNIWLCTAGSGINILSKDRKRIAILDSKYGLSNNETYQLIWQNPDQAWISTFNGLSRYNRQSRTFFNYYSTDGLSTNEFNHNAFLQDGGGRIWFGSINGINRFSPDSIPSSRGRATLFVSSLSKWDSRRAGLLELPANDTSARIVLLPQDHSLSFTLGLTDYNLPENNSFMYRLPGVFDEWVRLEGAQPLRLDGLAPGHYKLELKAFDGRGVPAANVLRYDIEVKQAFYKTWWFYLALFIITSLLIWTFFRMRLLNIKRVQRLRQQIASDLHDEVGSLLTRITMTSDNLRYSRNPEPEKAAKLEKIAALSRNASSSMSDILWAIDARNDYTGNLSDRMREHAEEMLLPQDTELQFDIQLSQRMSISSQLRQQLYLIFKEAINNIVKHSEASQVWIRYHHTERGFRLEVRNNGLHAGEKGGVRSQGLKNMRMRAERISAQINIDNSEGWFTIVLWGR
jgi:ligand-binding sensor domain-containing protein/signal transduction histidine kinase